MNDEQCPLFSPEVQQLIAQHRVFSGGRRHRELVADLLPAGAVWIDIIVPLSAVYQEYRALDEPVLVFASGDPLFFGFTTTLMREFPGQVSLRLHSPPHHQALMRLLLNFQMAQK